jgi:hypothetical protein
LNPRVASVTGFTLERVLPYLPDKFGKKCMDGGLKGLIAVICVVVIGGIGYIVLADISGRRNSGKVARITLNASYCRDRLSQIRLGRTRGDDIAVVGKCFVKGLVRQSDVVDAFKAGAKKRNGG